MPIAAKIASSSVGGSRLTRRGPYLVFQSSLMGAPRMMWEYLGHPDVALQYEIDVAIQPCIRQFKGVPALWRHKSRALGWRRRVVAARGRNRAKPAPRNAPSARPDPPTAR